MTTPARKFRRIGPYDGVLAVETPRPDGGTYYLTASTDPAGLSEQAIETMFELLESNLTAQIEQTEAQP